MTREYLDDEPKRNSQSPRNSRFARSPQPGSSRATPDYLGDEPNYGGRSAKQVSTGNGRWGLLRWPVFLGLLFGAGWALCRSYPLFRTFFQKMGAGLSVGVCSDLTATPFVGWMLGWGCANIVGLLVTLIAAVALAVITILETIPTLLIFSQRDIEGMINQLRRNRRHARPLEAQQDDNGDIEFLRKRHHQISEQAFRTLIFFSVAAFAFEAFVVYVARSGRGDLGQIFLDTFLFEGCIAAALIWSNIFKSAPPKSVRSFS